VQVYAAGRRESSQERSGTDVRPAKQAHWDSRSQDAPKQATLPDDLFSAIRLDSMDYDQLQQFLDHPMLERSPSQLRAIAMAGFNMARAWRSIPPYLLEARYCYSNTPIHACKLHSTTPRSPTHNRKINNTTAQPLTHTSEIHGTITQTHTIISRSTVLPLNSLPVLARRRYCYSAPYP
jgi:hypothetical protein